MKKPWKQKPMKKPRDQDMGDDIRNQETEKPLKGQIKPRNQETQIQVKNREAKKPIQKLKNQDTEKQGEAPSN